jgi:hypothetical protein
MKLTRLLTLSTAVLALLVCGMLAHITRDAWRRYDATSAGLQALRLTQSAMVAAEKLSFERGPVNAVLGDRIPVDPARRDRLQHGRARTTVFPPPPSRFASGAALAGRRWWRHIGATHRG